MKEIAIGVGVFVVLIIAGCVGYFLRGTNIDDATAQIAKPVVDLRPLTKYQIEELQTTNITSGSIELTEELKVEDEFTSHLFEFTHTPDLDENNPKMTTGLMNIPDGNGKYPLVVMFRGYVDSSIYTTGVGTRSAGEYFARNGFVTIAPDFLGYAGSDENSADIFESRFQTYVTALALIKSLDQVPEWNGEDVFIWGHSNGGQIALTVLEITRKDFPTTMWAPVSKPFPYSILYYTDESEDRGKLIRRELAKFEDKYDVDKYSLNLYLDQIAAPMQIHQGTADGAVPANWSNTLVDKLEVLEKDVQYHLYPGADHNLRPNWDTVIARDLAFFNSYIDE